jgi:putative ABC transport system permease protein
MRTRIAEGQMAQTLDQLESAWNEINPNEPFNYSYVTDLVAQQYEDQRRWKSMIQWASGIAILLACFGLFGLASLAAQRRTKEIGIRKVLGATITNIVQLLSKDFIKLVTIGFLIAVPIAWYAMNQWLADFAYKIEIGPGIFLLAGGLALLIALATVSWQSIRAALANPVDSLRSE